MLRVAGVITMPWTRCSSSQRKYRASRSGEPSVEHRTTADPCSCTVSSSPRTVSEENGLEASSTTAPKQRLLLRLRI